MEVPVSVYCNRCDRWFSVERDDLTNLKGRRQVLCEDCGNPIYLPSPHAWPLVRQRALDFLQSVLRRSRSSRVP